MNLLKTAALLLTPFIYTVVLFCWNGIKFVIHNNSLTTKIFHLQLQIEACNQEAVKLATLINNRTPMLASDPFLSHLIAARAKVSYFQSPEQTRDNIGGVSGSKSAKGIVGLFVISISLVLASLASF